MPVPAAPPESSRDATLDVGLFAIGGGGILFGLTGRENWAALVIGFGIVFFMLRSHLWAAVRRRTQ